MTLAPPRPADVTPDAALAGRFAANCRALGLDLPLPAIQACTARDGSTTATRGGQWLGGCSVPRLAAERMIRRENWPHRTLGLLTPTHGQQLVAVLAKLPTTSALIAVFGSADALADALACCDIAADASAGRLHVAWDEPSLAAVFDRHPGLAVPRQIVRLPDADSDTTAAVMPWTQATLTATAAEQTRRVTVLTNATANADQGTARFSGPLGAAAPCALVGRQFRLWDDAGDTLTRLLAGSHREWSPGLASCERQASLPANRATTGVPADRPSPGSITVVDTDHPLASADAHAAEHVAAATATVADRPRPAWATGSQPWVAWLHGDEVPPYRPVFADDVLLLSGPAAVAAARAAGWPADRLTLAGWPCESLPHAPGRPLALLYDLPDLAPPADVAELSTRQIVWEAIRDELSRVPFALGDDAERYVRRAPARLGLPMTDDFPVRRLVDSLVAPAFVVGVATWLAARGVVFTLHGAGWDAIESLAAHTRGPVSDRDSFKTIVANSGGVVDAFFTPAHPCHALGVPVLTVFGHTPQRVTQDVAAIRGGRAAIPSTTMPLSFSTISQLLLK